MSRRVTTAGMYLCYAVEATAGTRPTTGYKVVPEVKSAPSFNPTPEQIESTTLMETEFKTYEEGLKDLGGVLGFNANLTDDLVTFWGSVNTEFDTAAASSKAMWFALVHPKLSNAVFFTGDPAPIGLNEVSINAMAETTLYVTPTNAPALYAKPSLASGQTVLGN